MIPTKTFLELQIAHREIFDKEPITDADKLGRIASLNLFNNSRWVSVDVLQQKLQARIKSLQEWTKFDSNPQSTGYLRAFSQIDILKELLVELEQKEARP